MQSENVLYSKLEHEWQTISSRTFRELILDDNAGKAFDLS